MGFTIEAERNGAIRSKAVCLCRLLPRVGFGRGEIGG